MARLMSGSEGLPRIGSSGTLAARELELINEVELFQEKPKILLKVERRLEELRDHLAPELKKWAACFPPTADLEKGQIARGENHNGFPYRSLDLPQYFTKSEMFTYRTLFWWGHYLGFSLILKGEKLEEYARNIAERYRQENAEGIYLCLAPTPWEWEVIPENFNTLTDLGAEEIVAQITQSGFAKLLRYYPVAAPDFPTLNWQTAGQRTFDDMMDLAVSIEESG